MTPALTHHSIILNFQKPILNLLKIPVERGDIYTFDQAESKYRLIKRVIGLPGDTVWVADGLIYVNNLPLSTHPNEDLDGMTIECRFSRKFKVPEKHYFMMGDNLCNSMDSRYLGPIDDSQINSKFWRILYFAKD
jgi:signal peptidase I